MTRPAWAACTHEELSRSRSRRRIRPKGLRTLVRSQMRRVVSSLALMTMGWLSNLPTATSFTELVWPVRGGPMG